MSTWVESKKERRKTSGWPFLVELKHIRFRHLGFAFFWAWMSLFMHNKDVFLETGKSVIGPQTPLLVLTFSSFLTLVFVVFFLPSQKAPLSLKLSFKIVPAILIVSGTLLRAFGNTWGIFDLGIGAVIGSFIAGCGMIITMIMWAEVYGSVGALRAALYMPLSLIVSVLLYFVTSLAPTSVDTLLLCCYPILSVVFITLNRREVETKEVLSVNAFVQQERCESETKDRLSLLRRFLFLPWKICLAAGLYGVISGLVSSSAHISQTAGWLDQTGSALVSILLIVGVLIFGKSPQHNGFTYKPTLLVMVAGCISLLFISDPQFASIIVAKGYLLFYALSWIMYSDISYRLNLPSSKIFASGRLFGALGYALGMGFGYVFSAGFHIDVQQDPAVLAALTVCLLVFTAIFVLDEKDVTNVWGKQPILSSDEPQDSYDRALKELLKDRGLTPRESEVFELLSKGRSLPYIQSELHISYSTANSHTRNIYQKLGVHSKQELISLTEDR